jgi:hypothetical protein
MMVSQSSLFFQGRCTFTRTFAGPCVGASALATHGQTTAMTETTVATNVHQAFDVHGGFTPQITLDGENSDLVADFLEVGVGQIFDLFRVSDARSFANLPSAGATNTKDGGQAYLCMFVRRNVDASDTCHIRPLKLIQSALTLLVTWISADHTNYALAADDFTVATNFFHRSRNFHDFLLKLDMTWTLDQVKKGALRRQREG